MDVEQTNRDEYESLLRLLTGELRDLVRAERLSAEDRLSAIEQALTLAVGDSAEVARDFARDVVLGRLEP